MDELNSLNNLNNLNIASKQSELSSKNIAEFYIKELSTVLTSLTPLIKFKKNNKYKKKPINTINQKTFDIVNKFEEEFAYYDNIIENDTTYQNHLQQKILFEERLKSLRIAQEMTLSIIGEKLIRNVFKDDITKNESKIIIQNLNKKKKAHKKGNLRIVNEQEHSFSDDSIDYELAPILSNIPDKAGNKNREDLLEILSKAKSGNEINAEIRKNKKNMVKLKSTLEKDYKSAMLMVKYLGIIENND